ncbi:MAG: DUF4836 family protein [Chitinophagaceae bacterium]|nr:DUF4836 family protein [Chitinophagaceae bacterium]
MKRNSLLLGMLAMGLLILSACGSKSTKIAVPKDAMFVMHINSKSLSGKLSWDEIKKSEFFQKGFDKTTDSFAKQLMENPASSGMNTDGDFYVFVKKQGKGGYAGVSGGVKDAAAFEKFVAKITNNAAVGKTGSYKSANITNGPAIVWGNEQFSIINDVPLGAMNGMSGFGGGMSELYKFPADSLKVFGQVTLDLSGDASIGSDKRFNEMLTTVGDMHFWISGEQYLNGIAGSMLGMMKINDILQGNISTATLNFENGKITVVSKGYVNEKLADLAKKYPSKPISDDLYNRIPSANVAAAFAFNYPPEGLKEFIKLMGVDGLANGFLDKAGYSIDEFVKANKGDILVAVTDFAVKSETKTIGGGDGMEPYTYTNKTPDAKYLFAASINDRAAFDKLIVTLQGQLGEAGSIPGINYQLDKNWFVAGNDQTYNTKFLGGASTKQAWAEQLKGATGGGFVDIQKFIKGGKEAVTDSLSMESLVISEKFWQDIFFKSEGFKDGASQGYFEINLIDKTTNSLKQLNTYLNKLAAVEEKRKASYSMYDGNAVISDTAVVAPPAVENK